MGGQLDWWLVQVLEADALDVASIGRAVAAGAEVWRGGVPGGTEATGRRHQAADRGPGSLMLHPESWFYHRRAGPALHIRRGVRLHCALPLVYAGKFLGIDV